MPSACARKLGKLTFYPLGSHERYGQPPLSPRERGEPVPPRLEIHLGREEDRMLGPMLLMDELGQIDGLAAASPV